MNWKRAFWIQTVLVLIIIAYQAKQIADYQDHETEIVRQDIDNIMFMSSLVQRLDSCRDQLLNYPTSGKDKNSGGSPAIQ